MRQAIQTFRQHDYYWSLPSAINLPIILAKQPPNFRYKIDYFYYILDVVCDKMDYLDPYKEGKWVYLNAQKLRTITHEYKKYLDYLVDADILLYNHSYIVGERSRGYRIAPNFYNGDLIQIPVDKHNLSLKRKLKEKKKEAKQVPEGSDEYYYLTKWFNGKLTIDKEGAFKCIDRLYPVSKSNFNRTSKSSKGAGRFKALRAIQKLSNGDFYYKVDDNIGRFHTNLTNIKKELRDYMSYDGQKLVNQDIKNSQPFLSGILFKQDFYTGEGRLCITDFKPVNQLNSNNKLNKTLNDICYYIMLADSPESPIHKEFEQYLSSIQGGQFYEEVFSLMYPRMRINNMLRKRIKLLVLTLFFADNRHGPQLRKKEAPFKRKFPTVYKIFSLLKRHNKVILSHILQRTESRLIIEIITKRIALERPELPIFTVHDSIATTIGNEDYVASVMKEEIKLLTGLDASINREVWTPEVSSTTTTTTMVSKAA